MAQAMKKLLDATRWWKLSHWPSPTAYAAYNWRRSSSRSVQKKEREFEWIRVNVEVELSLPVFIRIYVNTGRGWSVEEIGLEGSWHENEKI